LAGDSRLRLHSVIRTVSPPPVDCAWGVHSAIAVASFRPARVAVADDYTVPVRYSVPVPFRTTYRVRVLTTYCTSYIPYCTYVYLKKYGNRTNQWALSPHGPNRETAGNQFSFSTSTVVLLPVYSTRST